MSQEYIEVVLVLGPDGSIQAGVPGGTTYERARPALEQFMAELGSDDLPVLLDGGVEQHRHPAPGERVRLDQDQRRRY